MARYVMRDLWSEVRREVRRLPVDASRFGEDRGRIPCKSPRHDTGEPSRDRFSPRPPSDPSAQPMLVLEAIADPILLLRRDGTLLRRNRAAAARLPAILPGGGLAPPGSEEARRLASYLALCARSALPVSGVLDLRVGSRRLRVRCWAAWMEDVQGGCILMHLPGSDPAPEEEPGVAARAEPERDRILTCLHRIGHEERLRLARDLHDQSGQFIAALAMGIGALEKHVASAAGREQIQRLRAQLDEVSKELHRIAVELRPTALDDFGLGVALRRLVADWGARSGVATDFGCTGREPDLASDVEITLYRLCQEALTNIAKHAAGVTTVSVALQYEGEAVSLIVEDDGVGCREGDLSTTRLVADGKFGIVGMRERVGLVGGQFEIESSPEAGTTLVARIGTPGRRI
ncbi:hypothetical protein LNAOJCKE_1326 [Methylorubrum aminovorans]|uniref:histidine kinase n=1 Tax=Methylorubrum aminovorans TaxID=269069 RepID=A0ABQ4UA46_9HYPH|nr:sensor histidine kinase [Methylorubrum aminovorans]GJE64126.1 hypothetical protein LNAOJCKE_1326 [Methylorubrum aminovorans]